MKDFCDLSTINHITVEALGFRHSVHNGHDRFTRDEVKITFDGGYPTVSIGGQRVYTTSIADLIQLISKQ